MLWVLSPHDAAVQSPSKPRSRPYHRKLTIVVVDRAITAELGYQVAAGIKLQTHTRLTVITFGHSVTVIQASSACGLTPPPQAASYNHRRDG